MELWFQLEKGNADSDYHQLLVRPILRFNMAAPSTSSSQICWKHR